MRVVDIIQASVLNSMQAQRREIAKLKESVYVLEKERQITNELLKGIR